MPFMTGTRVPAGTFHFFHHDGFKTSRRVEQWRAAAGYFAMTEVEAKGPSPNVLALKAHSPEPPGQPVGVNVLDAPHEHVSLRVPTTRRDTLAGRSNCSPPGAGELIAVIKIVSPGNKSSVNALKAFVRKAGKLLRRGIHLLIVDLFPRRREIPLESTSRSGSVQRRDFELPEGKSRTLAAYSAGYEKIAYLENLAVGDPLIGHAIFLAPERYVSCPLEATYQAS